MARSELNFTVQVLAAVMLLLVGWATSQAPGDADELCITGALADIRPVYPDNLEPLMDSRDYINLISPSPVFPPVWQVLDIDGFDDGEHIVTWEQRTFLPCRQTPFVCGFEAATGGNPDQNNWLITQHISRNVSGVLLTQAKVQIEYEFRSCIASPDNRCAATFDIWTYETSVIDPGAANNTNSYMQIHRIAPIDISGEVRESAIRDIDFRSNSETGFYLGIQDINSCIFIHRVLVFYYICPATTQNLIVHPETIAPPTGTPAEQVNAECVENAHPFFGSNPVLTCSPGGLWTVSFGCVCNPGFLAAEDGIACIGCMPGTYLSGSECVECPANSNTTMTSPFCPCNDGFFRRFPQEDNTTGCTQPPSAPTNLQVSNITSSSITLTWSPPEDDGGRNDTQYRIIFMIVGSSEVVMYPDLLNETTLELTGLSPFTQYVISVIAENGVSSQVSNNDGRTASRTVRTGEDLPSEIPSDSVRQESNILQWDPPASPNGVILSYNLKITQEREEGDIVEVTVIPHSGNDTRLDVNSLGLESGDYFIEIQAVTSIGPGNFSIPVSFTVVESCMPGTYLSGSECVECPANSNTTMTSPFCPCNDGFFRTHEEDKTTSCTHPPSVPTNLQVTDVTSSSVTLTWSPPEDDGGRNDTQYRITFMIVGSSEIVMYPDLLNETTLRLTGLSPFTQYVISVIAENGVSSQASNNDRRTTSRTVRTGEDLPSEIPSDSVRQESNVLQWEPPISSNGVILLYNLRITQETEEGDIVEVTVIPHSGNDTRLDVNSLGLESGDYFVEIQAVTIVGPGNFSIPVSFTVTVMEEPNEDNTEPTEENTGLVTGLAIGSAILGAALIIAIIVIAILLVVFIASRVKKGAGPITTRQIPPN